jgi:hypothetical protein
VTVPAASTDGTVERDFPNSIHFRTLTRTNVDASEIESPAAVAKIADKLGMDIDSDVGNYNSVVGAEEDHYDIFLHLPEKLQDEVKVEYGEAKGGAMAQFMARLFSFGSRDAVNDMEGKRNFDINEIMKAFQGMMPGGEIIQKAAGFMANPMAFQAMKNVNFRTYNYSFQLKPTSAMEATMIRNIVFAFKKSMLPGTAGENHGIWTLPNEWSIQFCGPIANWVDFPLTAVCTSCTVDYSTFLMAADPTSSLSDKGRGSPGSITLTLSFVETMQLSRQRFENEVAPKGQIRQGSEAGTKISNALAIYGSKGEIGSSDLSFEDQSEGQAQFFGKNGYDANGNYVGERASYDYKGNLRTPQSAPDHPDNTSSKAEIQIPTDQEWHWFWGWVKKDT